MQQINISIILTLTLSGYTWSMQQQASSQSTASTELHKTSHARVVQQLRDKMVTTCSTRKHEIYPVLQEMVRRHKNGETIFSYLRDEDVQSLLKQCANNPRVWKGAEENLWLFEDIFQEAYYRNPNLIADIRNNDNNNFIQILANKSNVIRYGIYVFIRSAIHNAPQHMLTHINTHNESPAVTAVKQPGGCAYKLGYEILKRNGTFQYDIEKLTEKQKKRISKNVNLIRTLLTNRHYNMQQQQYIMDIKEQFESDRAHPQNLISTQFYGSQSGHENAPGITHQTIHSLQADGSQLLSYSNTMKYQLPQQHRNHPHQ